MLSMRIKEELEKAVAAESVPKAVVVVPKVSEEKQFHKKNTVHGVLGLKDEPKFTGGAFMMRGPTTAQAPFMGFLHEFTGMKTVNGTEVQLPAHYQPYAID